MFHVAFFHPLASWNKEYEMQAMKNNEEYEAFFFHEQSGKEYNLRFTVYRMDIFSN